MEDVALLRSRASCLQLHIRDLRNSRKGDTWILLQQLVTFSYFGRRKWHHILSRCEDVPPAESTGHLCCWDPSRPSWRPRGWRSCSRRGSPWDPWCCPAAPLWCSWICTAACCSVGVQRRHLSKHSRREHVFAACSSRGGKTSHFKHIQHHSFLIIKDPTQPRAIKV